MLKIRTSNEEFYRLYRQALEDMAALRLPIAGTDHMVFLPAAGAAMVRRSVWPRQPDRLAAEPADLSGVRAVARWTSSARCKRRRKTPTATPNPAKSSHEMRYGELAHFKLIPHTPYYGTADATPLFLIMLHAAWRATGDRALLEQHLQTAEGCLAWIDNYGDRDGDGFQEYQTRSPAGLREYGLEGLRRLPSSIPTARW